MTKQIGQFIDALFSGYFKDHDGYVEIRFIGKDYHKSISKFCHPEDFHEATLEEIRQHNTDSHIYFGINPRPLSKGKKEDDIKDLICLWADVDSKDFEGGKSAALESINSFPLTPSIIVDSGHGFHCYWLLEEPITCINDDSRTAIKQTLSGIISKLGADKSRIPFCSLLRLPGTMNIKDEQPLECQITQFDPDKAYRLEDFSEYRDIQYSEPPEASETLPPFGTKTKLISIENLEKAIADAQSLEVRSYVKNRIIHGTLLRAKGADKTRSGRDMSIICSLICSDYDYETIRSIFFNSFLKCSNRIRQEGEKSLLWDVQKALEYVQGIRIELSPEAKKILEIKNSTLISGAEKPLQINAFVVKDLLTGEKAAGEGFKQKTGDQYFYFDKEEKDLMDLDGLDFYLFVRQRFGLLKRDFEEVKDAVKTEIKNSRQEVEPHKFAHFDKKHYVLYVSNHANTIYRLDGETIQACDNGIDAVFFESDPKLEPYSYEPDLQVTNYFKRNYPDEPKEISLGPLTIKFPPRGEVLGLSIEKFKGSYLDEFLVGRTHFGIDAKNDLTPDEQQFLFIVYFYSLFFKSIQLEKPILCFVGLRESGKSFIATSVGKVLLGETFGPSTFTKDKKDLAVVLGGNYYTVFDNLDSYVANGLLDMLCAAVTGAQEDKRELYTDRSQVQFKLDSFIAITSREPKFRRDDVTRRLLLFNTKEIKNALGRSHLWGSLAENRNKIMTEVLKNLLTVVKILKAYRDKPEYPCVCRMIADWEMLAKKMCCSWPENLLLRICMGKMSEKKSFFAIEEDPLYWVLHRIIYEERKKLEDLSATDLYTQLHEKAVELNIKDFLDRYKSPRALGRKLLHLRPELEKEFFMEVNSPRKKVNTYTFGPLGEEEEEGEEKEPETQSEAEEGDGTNEQEPDRKNAEIVENADEIAASEGCWGDLEELRELSKKKA